MSPCQHLPHSCCGQPLCGRVSAHQLSCVSCAARHASIRGNLGVWLGKRCRGNCGVATPGSAVCGGSRQRRQPVLGHKSSMECAVRQGEATCTGGHSRGSLEGVVQEKGRTGIVSQQEEAASWQGGRGWSYVQATAWIGVRYRLRHHTWRGCANNQERKRAHTTAVT